MSPALSIALSVALLALNGFFVAAEFAVVSAKRHRLEALASRGSAAARAAVLNSRELSLCLAGAQLGITLATLGLGALAKPAVADLLQPVLGLTPLPEAVAGAIATVVAVGVVVFLHMVVGEMAPKSWAITHPERSAMMLALPFRAFTSATRWLLDGLNAIANALLRLAKVDPAKETAPVQGPVELQLLLTASREHGLIDASDERLLSSVLDLGGTPVYAVTLPLDDIVTIDGAARAEDVERVSFETGRSRLVVVDRNGLPTGLVHVRDAVLAAPDAQVSGLAYETIALDQHDTVLTAVGRMRAARAQLALVTNAASADGNDGTEGTEGTVIGITALEDLLERVLGQFEDETDRPRA
ncbi:MAG: hemolysin family protein [Actinomycetota bacterium]|nr:hemolysin family protein [Actinomycetota bacterium]